MLDVTNLSCARGDRILFSGLSFSVKQGHLLHITGSNGCGKTTLLRTLCGLTRAIDGEIRWDGSNVRRLGDDYRARIAYIGHQNGINGELTPPENLRSAGDLAGETDSARVDAALARVALDPYSGFPAKILSQGQKRRLALARLLILERPLWILDEPLSALDVRSVDIVIGALSEHLERGGLAILTSHQELGLRAGALTTLSLENR